MEDSKNSDDQDKLNSILNDDDDSDSNIEQEQEQLHDILDEDDDIDIYDKPAAKPNNNNSPSIKTPIEEIKVSKSTSIKPDKLEEGDIELNLADILNESDEDDAKPKEHKVVVKQKQIDPLEIVENYENLGLSKIEIQNKLKNNNEITISRVEYKVYLNIGSMLIGAENESKFTGRQTCIKVFLL